MAIGMVGMDRVTGQAISGLDACLQRIGMLLGTPVGTRVVVRPYGYSMASAVDQPMNNFTIQNIFAAVSQAIATWEPDFTLSKVSVVNATSQGVFSIQIEGIYTPTNTPVSSVIALGGSA